MKVQVCELRIGNFLQFGGQITSVTDMYLSHFNCEIYGNSAQNQFTPIPLTSEWMEWSGRVKQDDRWIDKDNGSNDIELVAGGYAFCIDTERNGKIIETRYIMHSKYVHEFQNAHYSLEKEELIFKDK